MYASTAIRSVRFLLIVTFVLATFYFISRSYNHFPLQPSTDSYPPLGEEPEKPHHPPPVTAEDPLIPTDDINHTPVHPVIPADHAAPETPETPGNRTQTGKMKAAFVSLIRNGELWEIVKSIRQIEDRFNRHYHYPWVFLNEVPFTEEFIKATTDIVSGETHYGIDPLLNGEGLKL